MSTTTRRYTYADLLETPDDGNRYEIIDGELIVSAAPLKKHQRMLYLLSRVFGAHIDLWRLGHLYFAPVDVMFSTGDVVQPDLIFIRRDRLHIYQGSIVHGPPDAVLEVLSLSTRERDLGRKRSLFESEGVPEYWVADADTPDLMLFVLGPDGRYERVLPVDGLLHSRAIAGFSINLATLFADLAAD
jgi:Uma2 family endonuclease